MAEDIRLEPGQDEEAGDLRQQLTAHKATIKALNEQVATAHNALRTLARAYADAVPGAAEPDVAEQGCDDCSVEPGERHRYAGCPGNDRAATLHGLLANVGRSLASAVDDTERAESIEMLLDGWYAAWPDSAVTSPSYPLATELVRLLAAGSEDLARRADDAAQRADQLVALVGEILRYFTERGHPGRPCLRTGWVREETANGWRQRLAELTRPPDEPS